MKIIGLSRTDFTPKGETKAITGWKVYFTYEDKNVEGMAAEGVFFTDEKLCGVVPTIGDEVEVIYNKYGKPNELRTIKAHKAS